MDNPNGDPSTFTCEEVHKFEATGPCKKVADEINQRNSVRTSVSQQQSYSLFRNRPFQIICMVPICIICRVGTNFSLKIGNFFLENLFQILKKPFDVKRSSNSKYASLMSVSRQEVHEF